MIAILIPLAIFPIIVVINFFYYLFHQRYFSRPLWIRITEFWTVVLIPLLFLTVYDLGEKNDCCSDSAVFSPSHRVGIYLIVGLCVATYFYCTFRRRLAPPLTELLVNSILVLGIVLNVLIAIHINKVDLGALLWTLGNVPLILLLVVMLQKNKRLLDDALQQKTETSANRLTTASIRLLQAKAWIRYPLLALLALPLLLTLSLILFVFGQKPDTLLRAFTDTYKHGFSQLDYLCDNVQCGGHFLCSVAAKGNPRLVQPRRYGLRNGQPILCNRQLLVANAFEELLQEHWPAGHRWVRRHYNQVGNLVHRYYFVFNKKWVANLVYLLMKPLEWIFILALYAADSHPEDRIATQYLDTTDRMKWKEQKTFLTAYSN